MHMKFYHIQLYWDRVIKGLPLHKNGMHNWNIETGALTGAHYGSSKAVTSGVLSGVQNSDFPCWHGAH